MTSKSSDINLHRLCTNLDTIYDNQSTRVVAFLDIETAFNLIEWPFLWEILWSIGFPLVFVQWLQTIYHLPTASV